MPQPFDRYTDLVFPVKLTAKTGSSPIHYSATEQQSQPDGTYTDADGARLFTPGDARLVELVNADVNVKTNPVVWVKFRGYDDTGFPVYEFQAPAGLTPGVSGSGDYNHCVKRFVSDVCPVFTGPNVTAIRVEYTLVHLPTCETLAVWCVTNPTGCCAPVNSGSGNTGVELSCFPGVIFPFTLTLYPEDPPAWPAGSMGGSGIYQYCDDFNHAAFPITLTWDHTLQQYTGGASEGNATQIDSAFCGISATLKIGNTADSPDQGAPCGELTVVVGEKAYGYTQLGGIFLTVCPDSPLFVYNLMPGYTLPPSEIRMEFGCPASPDRWRFVVKGSGASGGGATVPCCGVPVPTILKATVTAQTGLADLAGVNFLIYFSGSWATTGTLTFGSTTIHLQMECPLTGGAVGDFFAIVIINGTCTATKLPGGGAACGPPFDATFTFTDPIGSCGGKSITIHVTPP